MQAAVSDWNRWHSTSGAAFYVPRWRRATSIAGFDCRGGQFRRFRFRVIIIDTTLYSVLSLRSTQYYYEVGNNDGPPTLPDCTSTACPRLTPSRQQFHLVDP